MYFEVDNFLKKELYRDFSLKSHPLAVTKTLDKHIYLEFDHVLANHELPPNVL